MTKEQREKLIFAQGMLAGLSWIQGNDNLAEAIAIVENDIEAVLKEEQA